MANSQSVLTAQQGTYIVNSAVAVEKSCDAIVCLEDTVFTSIYIGESEVSADYIHDPSASIKAGAIIRPMNAQKFTSVSLTSGSVALVL